MKNRVMIWLAVLLSFVFLKWQPVEQFVMPAKQFFLHLNQHKLEQLACEMDLNDLHQVFSRIFSELDSRVFVYPTENYFYFSFYAEGKEFWGNIRLPHDMRDQGYLGFAYWEFDNFPQYADDPDYFSNSDKIGKEDGVNIERISHFEYQVEYAGKTVTFALNQLEQKMPDSIKLRKGERFLMRTFDESGVRFFLLFNVRSEDFLWVLDEEAVPESFIKLEEGFLFGKRTQFVFYDDVGNNRKILVGVYAENIKRNNYYDGPFDQLADNYIDENTGLREGINRTYRYARGRVNEFGEFLDRDGQVMNFRMAITPYYTYYDMDDLLFFINASKDKKGDKLYSYLVYDSKKDVPK